MGRRTLAALALFAALTGCTSSPEGGPDRGRTGGPTGREGCRGVDADDVRGVDLGYGPDELTPVAGSGALCAAYWLPGANQGFVPQGLALDGRDVWVSGWRWNPDVQERQCVVTRVARGDGRRLAGVSPVSGAVGDRPAVTCHHGGGLAVTEEGLWVVETTRLWLLDPDLVGTGADPVVRVWRIAAPVRGSTVVDGRGELGIAEFRHDGRRGAIHWFDVDDVLEPSVLDLVAADPDDRQTAAARRTGGVTWMQGGTLTGRGLHLTQSHTRCGVLVLPGGRRVEVAPGTEDVELDGRDLWAVSESGARPYQRKGGRPLVPMLLRYDARALLAGPAPTCTLGG